MYGRWIVSRLGDYRDGSHCGVCDEVNIIFFRVT